MADETKSRKVTTSGPVRDVNELRLAHEFTPTALEQVVANVPWRNAIDVYAWGLGIVGTSILPTLWKLYAISGQCRVLVAKHILAVSGATSNSPETFVMGARNIVCDRFEVTVKQAPLVGGAAPPIASTPSKVSVTGYGVEPTGAPRGFPNPPLVSVLTRPPGASQFGGEFGGGAIRFFDKQVITNDNISQAPALLIEISGFSTALSTRWIHLFGTWPSPADGSAAAQYIIQVPAGASFSYAPTGGEFFPHDWGDVTLFNAANTLGPGLTYAVSTTPFVVTRELVGTMGIDVAYYGVP
jgi:hypothetical protein